MKNKTENYLGSWKKKELHCLHPNYCRKRLDSEIKTKKKKQNTFLITTKLNQAKLYHLLKKTQRQVYTPISFDHLIFDKRITKLSKKILQFKIVKGNNSEIISSLLKERGWIETSKKKVDLYWCPIQKKLQKDNIMGLYNHIPENKIIALKPNLYKNLQEMSSRYKININNIAPITFHIQLDSDRVIEEVQLFLYYYFGNIPKNSKLIKKARKLEYFKIRRNNAIHYIKLHKYFQKMFNQNCQENSQFLWILKPSSLNKGQGITLFSSLPKLQKLLEFSSKSSFKTQYNKVEGINKFPHIKSSQYVIQKYIQNPLLIDERKFDIRIFALINQRTQIFIFSSEKFSLEKSTRNNLFIHLTNNAIQKIGKTYGFFQPGNQKSMKQLFKYLISKQINIAKIMKQIKISIYLTLNILAQRMQKGSYFQLFGFDFIIDCQEKVWLLEVNSNPSLQLSSPLLQKLIPKMLQDCLKLTVDLEYNECSKSDEQRTQNLFILLNQKIVL